MSLSRLVPPNDAMIRVANPPNAANSAICRLPKPSKVSANRDGITRTARSVRSPAATDQAGHQAGARDLAPDRACGTAAEQAAAHAQVGHWPSLKKRQQPPRHAASDPGLLIS